MSNDDGKLILQKLPMHTVLDSIHTYIQQSKYVFTLYQSQSAQQASFCIMH